MDIEGRGIFIPYEALEIIGNNKPKQINSKVINGNTRLYVSIPIALKNKITQIKKDTGLTYKQIVMDALYIYLSNYKKNCSDTENIYSF